MIENKKTRPLVFGEVLFDHFPDGRSVLGGAPFNVAWHLHAFGLNPLMVSRIGDDEPGCMVRTAMQNWGMDCSALQVDVDHPTGAVEVHIQDGEPTYEIVDQVAYDYIDATQLPHMEGQWLLYHGSLAVRHDLSLTALDTLKNKTSAHIFVDINLRAPWWRKEQILHLIEGSTWVKLNTAELADIYSTTADPQDRLRQLGAQVAQHVVLTDGEKGATIVSATSDAPLSVTPQTTSTVVDTVGAGDAFCSVLVAGQLLGWPLETTMLRAQNFASAIVGIRGATTQDRDFYKAFVRDWGLEDFDHV